MNYKNRLIILENKETLKFDNFVFKCSIGNGGITSNKLEGDKKTPRGIFGLGNLFYRKDRVKKPLSNLKTNIIKKGMVWCDDIMDKKNYNRLVTKKIKTKHEKIFRLDNSYDYLIPILYNTKLRIPGKGSAIFIHLTKNYNGTAGCIALKKKDFLILVKLINKNTKIKII